MSEEKKWVLGLKRAISFIICLIILFTYPTKLMAAQEPLEEEELFAKAAVLMDGEDETSVNPYALEFHLVSDT